MTNKFNLTLLDVRAFVQSGQTLEGQLSLSELPRLAAENYLVEKTTRTPDLTKTMISWQLKGELRHDADGSPQNWLFSHVSTTLELQCQRCLQSLAVPLETHQWFRFVDTEAEAEQEENEWADEDLLSLEKPVNMREVLEDDLLMAIPALPMHDACQPPIPLTQNQAQSGEENTIPPCKNPFAKLGDLHKQLLEQTESAKNGNQH